MGEHAEGEQPSLERQIIDLASKRAENVWRSRQSSGDIQENYKREAANIMQQLTNLAGQAIVDSDPAQREDLLKRMSDSFRYGARATSAEDKDPLIIPALLRALELKEGKV